MNIDIETMAEGIRQWGASGKNPHQIKKILLKSLKDSGLSKNREYEKLYRKNLNKAIALYKKMPIKTEACQSCGEIAPVCIPCTSCGLRVCESCFAEVAVIPFEDTFKSKVTCKKCKGVDG